MTMDDETIIKACKEGNCAALTEWAGSDTFDWKKEFKWQDEEKTDLVTPALFVAIDYKQIDAVRLLLEAKGADVNFKDSNDYSPITWVAMNGSMELTNLLLDEFKARVDEDAIDQAKEHGHGELHDLLRSRMDWYAGMEDLDDVMMKASREGDVPKVQELIAKGYNMSKWKKEDGETYEEYSPIFVAMKNGHIEVIREFLEAGVEAELIETHFNHDADSENPAADTPKEEQEPLSEEQIEALREQLENMP